MTTPFLFNEVSLADSEDELSNLNTKKSSKFKNIPAKILKISRNSCSETLTALFNKTVLTGNFPNELKLADVTPVFKKENPLKSKNYRPVSVLPVVSKIFERIMHKQMSLYVDNFLSPYVCGYRKGFSTQQALLSLIEKWKNILDKKGYGGAVLMDISQAFDTLHHDLLIAKLHAYGFTRESLKLIKSYLTNRWQRTKEFHMDQFLDRCSLISTLMTFFI